MKKEFINFILCPVCRSSNFELQIVTEDNLEIREGQLLCRQCQTVFSIKKGILFFDKNISPETQKEKIAAEKEIEEQKDLIVFQDENWLLNYPFNKKMGIDTRTERIARLSTKNALLFLKKFDWPKKTRILELGAGNCWLIARLARKYECAALDILTKFPRGLEAADVFIKHNNVFFERISADMKTLPFKNSFFDIVLTNAALHHSPDLLSTLKEIYRILSPEGQLILLSEPSIGWFGGSERKRVIKDRERGFAENRYSLKDWLIALKTAGFDSYKIYLPFNLFKILKTKGRIFKIFGNILEGTPSFFRKFVINISPKIALTIFDGFFNAILYKKQDVNF